MKINAAMKEDLRRFFLKKLKEKDEEVEITSAYALSATELSSLKKLVPELKDAKITVSVDPELIAGYIIKKGSRIVNLSLQERLKKLHQISYETA